MSKLTASKRHSLPANDFAGSAKSESYPIPDKAHGRNALARVSQQGGPALKAKVRDAVFRKYPSIKQHEGK